MRVFLLLLCVSAICCQRVLHKCDNGEFWNGQRCLPCSTPSEGGSTTGYCQCQAYNTCDTVVCNSGAYKASENGKQCYVGCDSNCQDCGIESGSEVCYQCLYKNSSLQRIGSICFDLENANNCVFYDLASGVCRQCASGYYSQPQVLPDQSQDFSSNGASNFNAVHCQPCQIQYCGQCDSPFTCKKCKIGYQLVASYSSQPVCMACASSACLDCSQDLGKCLLCKTGYYLDASSQCSQCQIANCASCSDSGTCLQCQESYYLTVDQKTCGKCIPNCSYCKDNLECLVCQSGIQLSNKQCLECPLECPNCFYDQNFHQKCADCIEGYYLTDDKVCNSCQTVDSNATRCAGPNDSPAADTLQVTQCAKGYSNFSMFLTKTATGKPACYSLLTSDCLTITAMDASGVAKCQTCFPGLTLLPATGECKVCPSNCSKCAPNSVGDTLVCSECVSTFYLDSKSACNQCPSFPNCLTCPAGSCSACVDGYYLYQSQCVACDIASCKSCSGANQCTNCKAGFYQQTTGTITKCVACRSDCATCSSPGNVCDSCPAGSVKQGTGCLNSANAHCAAIDNATGTCKVCEYGYYQQNGLCLQCVSADSGFVCRENLVRTATPDANAEVQTKNGRSATLVATMMMMMILNV